MKQLITWAEIMEVKHVLFIFDSCFSGTIFKQRSANNQRNAYTQFAQKVGWYQNNDWLSANELFNQVPSQSGFFPLWFIYQGKLGQYPFGLPSNHEFIRDPNAIIVSPGTMLAEKLQICPI